MDTLSEDGHMVVRPEEKAEVINFIEIQRNEIKSKAFISRGSSYSLVELPTFLTCPVVLGGPVCDNSCSYPNPSTEPKQSLTLGETLATYQFKTSRDLAADRRSRWSIMFVGLVLFTACLVLVGTMLSFVTEYQDKVILRLINISNIKYNEKELAII